jgi:hypothetical protein
MAVKAQYQKSIPVQLTTEWYDRIKAIADDERCNLSMATVIRDCIENVVPGIELQLGLVDPEEVDEEEAVVVTAAPAKKREDRTVGLFGGPPRPE